LAVNKKKEANDDFP